MAWGLVTLGSDWRLKNRLKVIKLMYFLFTDATTSTSTCSRRSDDRMWPHSSRLRSGVDIVEKFRQGKKKHHSLCWRLKPSSVILVYHKQICWPTLAFSSINTPQCKGTLCLKKRCKCKNIILFKYWPILGCISEVKIPYKSPEMKHLASVHVI